MTTICDEVEVWEKQYQPIINHFIPEEETTLFETYGQEVEFVYNQPHEFVWTWVDGDDGTYIVAGRNLVNRIGYFVTKKSWFDWETVIPYEKYENK